MKELEIKQLDLKINKIKKIILINHKRNPDYDETIKIFDNDTKFLLTEKELNNNIEEFNKINNYLRENFGEDFTDNGYPVSEEITSWDE